ncbi:MAG: hypothetical protein BWY25_03244 [Chloroflexi bacterium ADurb.Bin222]|nr:MAG: hypothetical protein BWY25_03244 [Chloroflexi bacterium ADurb.Bin222]
MRPLMDIQVNQFRRFGDALESGFLHGDGRTDERDHGAVVIGVRFHVQHPRIRHGAHGRHDRLNHLGTATFTEVGDTFDERFQ